MKILVGCFVFGSLVLFLLLFLGANPNGATDPLAATVAGGMIVFLGGLGLLARISR